MESPRTAGLVAVMLLLVQWPAGHATAVGSREQGEGPQRALMIEAEEGLVCQCGCGLTVHACNHLNCPSGIPMKEEIAKRVAEGQTIGEILAYFRTKYGEKVLSAPTLEGFNLVAWIMPGVFVLLGLVLVGVVVRRWSHAGAGHGEETAAAVSQARSPDAPADPYRDRLTREIEEFDG